MNAEIRLGIVRRALEQKMREAVSNGQNHKLMEYKSLWVECLDKNNVIDQAAFQAWERIDEELDQQAWDFPFILGYA